MASSSITATPTLVRVREDRAIFRALRIVEQRAAKGGPFLTNAVAAEQLFRLRLGNELREHFEVAFLDNRNRMLAVERLFSGTIDSASVHPRVLVQRALAVNAAAVIVAHNHPSGDPTPSAADRAITWSLRAALALIEVRLLDHVVVGASETCSMARQGLLSQSAEIDPVPVKPVRGRRVRRSKAD